jgi:hypothetical protein
MKNSEIMALFAQANRKCGYTQYADFLDDTADQYQADSQIGD